MTKMTPEREKRRQEICDEWIKIGMSCEPCDFEKAKDAATRAYEVAGEPVPKYWLLVDSPISCAIVSAILKYAYDKAGVDGSKGPDKARRDPSDAFMLFYARMRAYLRDDIKHPLVDALSDADWKEMPSYASATWRDRLREQVYGSHDAGWLSHYVDKAEDGEDISRAQPLIDLAQVCGWWAPYSEVCILQHRHAGIEVDEQGRIHNETGPAVAFGDSLKVYAIHGVNLKEHVIMAPETITVQEIKDEENAEVRRIMRERFGTGRYLRESGAKLIDADYEGALQGAAPRALLEDSFGDRFLVGTDGSTTRVYYMPLPEGTNLKTCREAHEELCGFDESTIISKS